MTALSYGVMTGYDRLAIVYIRHPLDAGRVTLASFISYAFSNTIGFSLLTSGSIRYRLYSAWGLSAEEIARLITFTVLTFWLGIITVAGAVFVAEPMALPILGNTAGIAVRPLGFLFVFLVVGFLLVVAFRKRPFQLRNWTFPSRRSAWPRHPP